MIIKIGNNKISNVKICNNYFSKLLGLMFSKPKSAILKNNYESKTGTTIHTLFMRFPIDVHWLNKNLEVVDLKKNVKPYKMMIVPKKKAMYVLETPVNQTKIKIGQKINIINDNDH